MDAEFWVERVHNNGDKEGLKIVLIDTTPGEIKKYLMQFQVANPTASFDPTAQKILDTGKLPCALNRTNGVVGTGKRGGITKSMLAEVLQQVKEANPGIPRPAWGMLVAARLGVGREWINALRREWGL